MSEPATNDNVAPKPAALHPEMQARVDEGSAVLAFFSTLAWRTAMEFEEFGEEWRDLPEQVCRPGVFTADTMFEQLEILCKAGLIEPRLRGGGRNGVEQYVEYRLVKRVQH